MKHRIMRYLNNVEEGQTISDIANGIGISRPTVYKYIEHLEEAGRIRTQQVGVYRLYFAKKRKNEKIIENLYLFFLSSIQDLQIVDQRILSTIISSFKTHGRELISRMKFPRVKLPFTMRKRRASLSDLEKLVEPVQQMLYFLTPLTTMPRVEIVPPLGNLKPMTLLIRMEDPGYIPRNAKMHYYLIARIIEEKLSILAKKDLYFKVAKDIDNLDDSVLFELGYVEEYFHDFSIVKIRDDSVTEDELLDEIYDFYNSIVPVKLKKYKKEGKQHYLLRFNKNRDLEEVYELAVRTNKENMEIAMELMTKLSGELSRQWVPLEEYQDDPYAIVDMRANIGYLMDEHLKTSAEAYKFGGISLEFKEKEDGWLIYCKDRVDFDVLFTPMTDDDKRKKVYAQLTPTPEEFLKLRKEALQRRREMIRKIRASQEI